jgi:hypothetical protein
MLDLIKGPFYVDVYSIGRALLADREHQVLFLVNFSEIEPFWIANIHLPDSSKKDDYLTIILLAHSHQ